MDIPNDLNRLLAELKSVSNPTRESPASDILNHRPSAIEIKCFLKQYGFGQDTLIEPIEISKDGAFEFYMFAVLEHTSELSLLTMWPED